MVEEDPMVLHIGEIGGVEEELCGVPVLALRDRVGEVQVGRESPG